MMKAVLIKKIITQDKGLCYTCSFLGENSEDAIFHSSDIFDHCWVFKKGFKLIHVYCFNWPLRSLNMQIKVGRFKKMARRKAFQMQTVHQCAFPLKGHLHKVLAIFKYVLYFCQNSVFESEETLRL